MLPQASHSPSSLWVRSTAPERVWPGWPESLGAPPGLQQHASKQPGSICGSVQAPVAAAWTHAARQHSPLNMCTSNSFRPLAFTACYHTACTTACRVEHRGCWHACQQAASAVRTSKGKGYRAERIKHREHTVGLQAAERAQQLVTQGRSYLPLGVQYEVIVQLEACLNSPG